MSKCPSCAAPRPRFRLNPGYAISGWNGSIERFETLRNRGGPEDKKRQGRGFAMVQGAILPARGLQAALIAASLAACATVKVQAPDKPIEINLNVKIEQEVRVKLDKEVTDLIAKNPDVF